MNTNSKTKKIGADKIVLLGLFVLALLIARTITSSRSAILLSDPIQLTHTGLSISIPLGNGWQSKQKWQHMDNTLTLSSFFGPVADTAADAQCRYLLAAAKQPPEDLFEKKASQLGAKIEKTDQVHLDNLTIDWAHIKIPQELSDIFFAIATLPNGRQLEIQVRQSGTDTELAEQTFVSIIESLKFEPNQLLTDGSQIVSGIKDYGLAATLEDKSSQEFFLIENNKMQTIGFTTDVLIELGEDTQLNILAANHSYRKTIPPYEQITFFRSDNRLDQFSWKSEISRLTGGSGIQISADSNGIMTVTTLGPSPQQQRYQLGPAAIPSILTKFVFMSVLENDYEEVVVDIINAAGQISPVLITKTQPDDQGAYALKLTPLESPRLAKLFFLDDRMQIIKISQPNKGLIFERSTRENIVSHFPQKGEYILEKDKILEQEQSQ